MGTYFELAWRNLWRNKKRTLIAAASVFFAVLLALIMRSMQQGTYNYMINSSVSLSTGYLQVHAKGFWDKRSLDKSMMLSKDKLDEIKNIPHITNVLPRLDSYTLISYGRSTKVTPVYGIDPRKENSMTKLKDKLIKGSYLSDSSKGMIISQGLADILKVSTGDSVVLYGQGYQGVTAAAQVPILGIVKIPIPDLNKASVYISLNYAQWLFSAPDRITSISIMIDKQSNLDMVTNDVKKIYNNSNEYEVMKWSELMPELVQSIQVDNAGGIIMLGILYIVIGFGVFGTIMMMTAERAKEFGILISVGMKKWKLVFVTTIETLFISFIGVIIGAIISFPILLYMYYNPIHLSGDIAKAYLAFGLEPIMPFAINAGMFIAQIWTVLAITLLSALYPYFFVRKLVPIEAIRN